MRLNVLGDDQSFTSLHSLEDNQIRMYLCFKMFFFFEFQSNIPYISAIAV